MGPAVDNATVPDGNNKTSSTGGAVVESPPMTISQVPLLASCNLIVPSYDPVKTRWGLEEDTSPDRT